MKISDEARIWAQLDGSEGGDLLNALASTFDMAHYAYSEGGEIAILQSLERLMRAECDIHREMATGPNRDDYGYEPERVKAAIQEIESADP